VFPGSAAADAGFARGDEILAIGDTPDALVLVTTLVSGATTIDDALARVSSAFGPSTAGVTRSFEAMPAGGTAAVLRTATKRTYSLDPVPQGAVLIPQGTGVPPVGYVALRTFITPAEPLLTEVFGQFVAAGVQDVIVDLRYNGGGRITTADVLANLLGGARSASDIELQIQYNPYHANANATWTFAPVAQSVAPLRIAFITTGATASASELVANAMEGWMHADVALVGAKTYGKPVGQLSFQLTGCDSVVAIIGFRIVNREGDGDYYDGLPDAGGNFSGPLCAAADDLGHAQWDPAEASTATALQWLATGVCPPPPAAAAPGATALRAARGPDAYPESPAPDLAQRHVRGLF
jgi:C-terminal processing protease CtpA/Prc